MPLFSQKSRTALKTPGLLSNGYRSSFVGAMQPRHDADHQTSSIAEVKMSGVTLLLHLHASMAWTGATLTLTLPLVRCKDICIQYKQNFFRLRGL